MARLAAETALEAPWNSSLHRNNIYNK